MSSSICSSGATGGSQQLTVLEAETSLTGNEWQKHTTVTGPEAPCIFSTDYLRRGYFKGPKEYHWLPWRQRKLKQLSAWPLLSEDHSVVGLLKSIRSQSLPQWCTSSNTAPDCPGILKVIKDWPEKILEHHYRRRWPILKRTPCLINYQKMRSNMPYLLIVLPHCWKGAEIDSPVRSCWRRRWINWVCRGESHPAGFKHCWMKKMANILVLYWLMCSGKCFVGWLQWWKQSNWQHKGEAIWAATL